MFKLDINDVKSTKEIIVTEILGTIRTGVDEFCFVNKDSVIDAINHNDNVGFVDDLISKQKISSIYKFESKKTFTIERVFGFSVDEDGFSFETSITYYSDDEKYIYDYENPDFTETMSFEAAYKHFIGSVKEIDVDELCGAVNQKVVDVINDIKAGKHDYEVFIENQK